MSGRQSAQHLVGPADAQVANNPKLVYLLNREPQHADVVRVTTMVSAAHAAVDMLAMVDQEVVCELRRRRNLQSDRVDGNVSGAASSGRVWRQ